MLVSIIMPSHNEEEDISPAIESVLSQTYSNWELIVADDGSTDRTPEIIKEFADRDERIKTIFFDTPQGSAGPVRNAALEQAEGRYIAFLDADDVWNSEKLERQLDYMERTGATLCSTYATVVAPNGEIIGSYEPRLLVAGWDEMLTENVITTSSLIIDKQAHPDIHFPDIKRAQDYACWMDIMAGGAKVHVMDEDLVDYRVAPEKFWKSKPKQLQYRWQVHREHLGRSFFESCIDMVSYTIKGLNKAQQSTNSEPTKSKPSPGGPT